MHLLPTTLTVPPQHIQTALGPLLLQHNAHCILESHRIMRRVRRQQKHVAFVDMDVAELLGSWEGCVDDLEQHGAFVLVEPFRGLVDVVVCALVGAADDHDGDAIVVDAVVVDGRLEHVGVLGDPGFVMLAIGIFGFVNSRTIWVCLEVRLSSCAVVYVRSGVVREVRKSAVIVALSCGVCAQRGEWDAF
jgi:hypothetical protein